MLYPSELRARLSNILLYSAGVARQPFVWQVQVRRELIDDELAQLRELPYSLWREAVGSPMTKTVGGRDDRTYTIKVTAEFETPGSDDIRVTVALIGGGLRRTLAKNGFIITQDNKLYALNP